jgi:hypothetical protein
MSAAAAETHASILSLPQLVNNDAGLVRRGRYLAATLAENPAQFRRYMLPVLDEIRAAAG